MSDTNPTAPPVAEPIRVTAVMAEHVPVADVVVRQYKAEDSDPQLFSVDLGDVTLRVTVEQWDDLHSVVRAKMWELGS